MTLKKSWFLFVAMLALGAILPATAAAAAPFQFGVQSDGWLLEGAGTGATQTEDKLQQLDDAGVQVVRVTLGWDRVATNAAACQSASPVALENPAHACYDWSAYDEVFAGAQAHGIKVLASLYYVPSWVFGKGSTYVGTTDAQFNRMVELYSAFAKAAGARYGTGAIGKVSYWTLGNEPNSKQFWNPQKDTPKRYAKYFVSAARKLREGAPGAVIAFGPTSPHGAKGMPPAQFLRVTIPQLMKQGAKPYVNAIAHNPYPSGARISPRVGTRGTGIIRLNNLDELLLVYDSFSLTRKKPVWATEFAYQSNPPAGPGVSLNDQARYLAECFDLAQSTKRIQIGIWYVWKDNNQPGDWKSGVVTRNGALKPAYYMLQRPITASVDMRVRGVLTRQSVRTVRRGQTVRVWGASLLSAGSQKLQWSVNKRSWKTVKAKKSGGISVGAIRASRRGNLYLRVADAKGTGVILQLRVS